MSKKIECNQQNYSFKSKSNISEESEGIELMEDEKDLDIIDYSFEDISEEYYKGDLTRNPRDQYSRVQVPSQVPGQ